MTGVSSNSSYNVGGYQPGDRIGAGVVVDPTQLKEDDRDNIKQVTVDMNQNGYVDREDAHVTVQLPQKGYIPVNWNGPAANPSFSSYIPSVLGGAFTGGVMGSSAGLIKAGTGLKGAGIGIALGITIGVLFKNSQITSDAKDARSSSVPNLVAPKTILNHVPSHKAVLKARSLGIQMFPNQ